MCKKEWEEEEEEGEAHSSHPTFSPLENMLLKISCKSEVWNIQIFTRYTSGVEVVICGEGATKNYEILIVVSMLHFF